MKSARTVLSLLAIAVAATLSAPLSPARAVTPAGPQPESAFTATPDGGQYAPNATQADCLTGYTCWFGDVNYSGWIQRYADVQTANISYSNQMSSWINRNTRAASWFTGSNGSGTGHCMEPNTAVAQLLNSENDSMVSFKIYSQTSC